MKLRILAVLLIVTLSAWLPLAAQQSAPASQAPAASQDTGKTAVEHACCCCDHKAQTDKDKPASAGHSDMACCQGKDAKDMPCCGKGSKDAKATMDCCKGKDAKMCAKDGKSCCGSGDAKCCGGKDAKNCCASASDCCGGHSHAT
jgi:hypothetical protein